MLVSDNDSKVSALQALERKLSSSSSAEDVDSTQLEPIISLLKLSLRNGNSHVYAAGVSCSVALFKTIDEHWHILKQNNQSTAHIDAILKNAVHTLALPPGGLITFLGDAKDSVRAAARVALVQAAISSAAVLASDSRLPPDQQPLAILDKLIKEQGFGSKNAKTREQVWHIREFTRMVIFLTMSLSAEYTLHYGTSSSLSNATIASVGANTSERIRGFRPSCTRYRKRKCHHYIHSSNSRSCRQSRS